MSRSIDPRRPLPEDVKPALRGDKRTGPIGTILPGDHVEVARDIQRIWLAIHLMRRGLSHVVIGAGSERTLPLYLNGLGAELVTGIAGDAVITFPCTVTGWALYGDQVGDLAVDLWKADYDAYPPTVADTITAGAQPTLSASDKNRDTALDGWTVDVQGGDVFRVNVDSVAAVTRAVLAVSLQA